MAEETKEPKATDLKSRVAVVATDKHPFAEKGEKFDVHPSVAEGFLKNGYIEKFKATESE